MIGAMVGDVLTETRARAAAARWPSAEDVRALGRPLVAFSAAMFEDLTGCAPSCYARMYRHHRQNRTRSAAQAHPARPVRPVHGGARRHAAEPGSTAAQDGDEASGARVVCDYIAGMTDRFAIEEHRRLFGLESWR